MNDSPSPSRWIVLKLGSAELADPATWRTFASVIRLRIKEGLRPLVVVPALPGMPELFWKYLSLGSGNQKSRPKESMEIRRARARAKTLEMSEPYLQFALKLGLPEDEAKSLLAPDLMELGPLAIMAVLDSEASARAQVMSFTERMTARIVAAYLNREGIPATWYNACFLLRAPKGGGPHPSGVWEPLPVDGISRQLEAQPRVVVTEGGVAGGHGGKPVRLEPAGADLSASYLAAFLGAERCEIWSDSPGLFTADPLLVPSARLLGSLGYQEAQEILASGAPGPHPRVIPPLRHHRIPLHLVALRQPAAPGTVVSSAGPAGRPRVKAVTVRTGVTLISMETLEMWQEAGFLAAVFGRFARHGLSIDCVSTSESNVTVSLNPAAGALEEPVLAALLRDLEKHCAPRVIAPAAALSLVGRGISAALCEANPGTKVLEETAVHLVTKAANDVSLTLIVDEDQGERLVRQLHELLIGHCSEATD
jgi:diaminopimelate decarboxylase/aspartate kinase